MPVPVEVQSDESDRIIEPVLRWFQHDMHNSLCVLEGFLGIAAQRQAHLPQPVADLLEEACRAQNEVCLLLTAFAEGLPVLLRPPRASMRPVRFDRVLLDAVEAVRHVAASQRAIVDVAACSDEVVATDPRLLGHILRMLAHRALRSAQPGERMQVQCTQTLDALQVRIRSPFRGMSREAVDAFRHGDAAALLHLREGDLACLPAMAAAIGADFGGIAPDGDGWVFELSVPRQVLADV